MCDCIERTEQEYIKHLKKTDSNFENVDVEVEFANKALMFDSGKVEVGLPMNINWVHVAKSGRTSNKSKKVNFIMQYCPFCGEKQN